MILWNILFYALFNEALTERMKVNNKLDRPQKMADVV